MIIGIDFDNTIARYDNSFKKIAIEKGFISKEWNGQGKTQLRDYLHTKTEGEKKWMKLQGLVYGKYMDFAEIMPGVAKFLILCKSRKIQVFIVSHKTEYGHFDSEKISLRQQAIKWMIKHRFFDLDYLGLNQKRIFFAESREEKVNIIASLRCEYFIDDLPEVFQENHFPESTKKILFSQIILNENGQKEITIFNNWEDISKHIIGPPKAKDIYILAQIMTNEKQLQIEKLLGQGNSCIYKVKTTKNKYALKCYPDLLIDNRPRLKTEFDAFNLLYQFNISEVPIAIRKDEYLNLGIYEWVEGKKISSYSDCYFDQMANFVNQLDLLSKKMLRSANNDTVTLASEACLSALDLIKQINQRYNRLKKISYNHYLLAKFLKDFYEPLWLKVKDKFYKQWPKESRDCPLPSKKQILSPSDFGLHNAIEVNKKIIFLDFEYFGWDDPVKLTADVIWHPAMGLSTKEIERWKNAMCNLFSSDSNFEKRLNAALPLYGLRWVMIILNEFLPNISKRRKNAGGTIKYNADKMRDVQLMKAKKYCKQIKKQC